MMRWHMQKGQRGNNDIGALCDVSIQKGLDMITRFWDLIRYLAIHMSIDKERRICNLHSTTSIFIEQ